jgi:glycosyltransferase involved in cell wall biosynthesis
MCCGVPVIASRLGALPEAMREGENGLLFTAGSSSELAVLIRSLDKDRSLLEKLRDGISLTDWIGVDERVRRMEAVLNQVCAINTGWDGMRIERQESQALRALLT